jgi:hypothetical protein
MGEGKRRIPWGDVRAVYESGCTNFSELARRFEISKSERISAKAKAQGWVVSGELLGDIQGEVRGRVVDLFTRKTVDALGGEAGIDHQANEAAANLLRHGKIETLLLDIAIDTLEKLKDGTLRAGLVTSEADERRKGIDAAVRALTASRTVQGIERGTPSVNVGGDAGESSLTITHRRIEPVKIYIDQNGRAINESA